jgi:uncharacterized protein
MTDRPAPPVRDLALFAFVAAPFFLNDFLFIASQTAAQWLAADYGSKVLALAVLFAVPGFRAIALASFARPRAADPAIADPRTALAWAWGMATAVLAAALIVGLDNGVAMPLADALPDMALFAYPAIETPALYWFDLSAGLALTAVAEELVFRTVARDVLARLFASEAAVVVISALIFAAIHWANGVGGLVLAFIAGVVLMAVYRRTGSIVPAMVAHFLVNLWDFA